MNWRLFLKIGLVMMFWTAGGCALGQTDLLGTREKGRQWFGKAKFGVFVHYLGRGDDWNEKVDSFDVRHFVDQIARTKARYVVFTLGQNSGYYCSPNATYEKYAGYKVGQRCSKRDLPMEIADALASVSFSPRAHPSRFRR